MKGKTMTLLVATCFILFSFSPLVSAEGKNLTSTVEVSMDGQQYCVELSEVQRSELDQIFCNLSSALDIALFPLEVERCVKESLTQLQRLGLLQNCSVQEVLDAVLLYYRLSNVFSGLSGEVDDDEGSLNSFFSLLVGNLNANGTRKFLITYRFNYLTSIFSHDFFSVEFIEFLHWISFPHMFASVVLTNSVLNRFTVGKVLTFGSISFENPGHEFFYPNGSIQTVGLFSDKLDGVLKGDMLSSGVYIPSLMSGIFCYPGIFGYTGLVIKVKDGHYHRADVYLLGGAVRTKLCLTDLDMEYGGSEI